MVEVSLVITDLERGRTSLEVLDQKNVRSTRHSGTSTMTMNGGSTSTHPCYATTLENPSTEQSAMPW